MLRGLRKLIWIEIKIFVREPLGFVGTVAMPVLVFIGVGRLLGDNLSTASSGFGSIVRTELPVFVSILIAINAVLSLITIIAIYREGGILKRLRATPLRPPTILVAHVIVKLTFTAATLALMILAGRRFYPVDVDMPVVGFTLALLFSTWSILSLGFVIASIVPTARFAQPLGGMLLFPMVALSGLFYDLETLPRALELVARALPITYAVSLLRGIWSGAPWSAHLLDVTALVVVFAVCTGISAKVFRWE